MRMVVLALVLVAMTGCYQEMREAQERRYKAVVTPDGELWMVDQDDGSAINCSAVTAGEVKATAEYLCLADQLSNPE